MNNRFFSHFIWQHVLQYHHWLWLYMLLCLLWALQSVASPFLLKFIIDQLLYAHHSLPWSSSMQQLILLYISLEASRSFSGRLLDACLGQLLTQVSSSIIHKTVKIWLGNENSTLNPTLLPIIQQLAEGSNVWLNNGIKVFQYGLLTMVVFASFISIQPLFALLLFAWISLFITITLCFADKLHNTWLEWDWWQKAQDRWLGDRLKNKLNVQLFTKKSEEWQHFIAYSHKTADHEREGRWQLGKAKWLWDISCILLLASLLIGLTVQYQAMAITAGDIFFVLIVTFSLIRSLWHLAEQVLLHIKILASCQQTVLALEEQQTMVRNKQYSLLNARNGQLEMKQIVLQDNHDKVILHLDKLLLPGKQSVAVVGHQDSGKNKLCPLILRLEESKTGSITIDGQDIAHVSKDSLREQITYLQSSPTLMAGSLADNILYGRSGADKESMLQASEMAHCHEWITNLDDGYDSDITTLDLSEQQLHGLAMARALLKQSAIVLIEDSHPLGSEHDEKQRQQALLSLIKDRSALILTHHIQLLPHCDKILVMHQGEIIQEGHHDDLVRQPGHYSILWSRQSGGFLPSFD